MFHSFKLHKHVKLEEEEKKKKITQHLNVIQTLSESCLDDTINEDQNW